jgi:hypothetical protein
MNFGIHPLTFGSPAFQPFGSSQAWWIQSPRSEKGEKARQDASAYCPGLSGDSISCDVCGQCTLSNHLGSCAALGELLPT